MGRGDYKAKFWLQPIALAVSFGFAEPELRDIQRLVEEHCDELIEAFIFVFMAGVEELTSSIAVRSWVEDGRVWLELSDQRLISFPVSKYRRLAGAPEELVKKVQLRAQGRALRWEELERRHLG